MLEKQNSVSNLTQMYAIGIISFILFLSTLIGVPVYSFIPTKAELLDLEAWQIGLILGGGAVIFSIISYTIGALSDRFGRRRFVIAAQVLIIVAGISLMFSNNFPTLLFFYGLFCIGETMTYLLCFVYATDIFDESYIGTSMGAFDSIMDLALIIGPLLAIVMYKTFGNIEPIFILVVFPAVFAFFVMIKWLPNDAPASIQQKKLGK